MKTTHLPKIDPEKFEPLNKVGSWWSHKWSASSTIIRFPSMLGFFPELVRMRQTIQDSMATVTS